MRYLITGGTGLVGSQLIDELLAGGHEVVNMSRSGRPSGREGLLQLKWNGKAIPAEVKNIDVVINLAGASIAKRWTEAYKKIVLESRINSTQACVDFIEVQENKPKVFLSASGINYYGSDFSEPKTEDDDPGVGFLSEVCQEWEKPLEKSSIRTIALRISPVLSTKGGPLEKLLTPFKMFVGGPTGSGDQGFSWIHLDDLVGAIHFLVDHETASGPFNMTAPEHITNRQFASAIGKAINRPSFFRLPKFALETIFGDMSVVLWGGTMGSSEKIRQAGYQFKFPTVKEAMADLLQD